MGVLRRIQRLAAWLVALALCAVTPSGGLAQPAAAETGKLQVLLFRAESSLPLAGARLHWQQQVVITNANGAALLELPAGSHVLRVVVVANSGAEASVDLPEVVVTARETSQLIATVTAEGALDSVEIEAREIATPDAPGPAAEDSEGIVAMGSVRGTVLSLEGGTPVAGARVFVRGLPVEAETNAEGRFTLELPEGGYTVSIIHTSFSTQTLDNVTVRPADTTELRVDLTPAAMALDDFIVTAPFIHGTVASLMDTRRESAAATDSIGAEEIGRTPANDAAGAAQRVVGATIVDGRYVYVRGLGERYTNARLNNSPMPSPEPDRATVPLDLFPAQIIKRLEISKTFTPDMPADFAGGSVQIETLTIPEEPVFQLSLSSGWNSQSTFRGQESYEGGSTDWLGFDDGGRRLPDSIPTDYMLGDGQRRPDGTRVSNAERDALAADLNSNMATRREVAGPNLGGSLLVGDSWRVGRTARLGAVASLNYRRKFTTQRHLIREFVPSGRTAEQGDLDIWSDFEARRAAEVVRWGAFASVSMEFSDAHAISLSGFRSQLADKNTDIFQGYNSNSDATLGNSRLSFASRSLSLLQLQGKHIFALLANAKLDWDLSLARAGRDEPDTRDVVYQLEPAGYRFLSSGESGRHFFSDQIEDSRGGAIDWTQPIPGLLHDTKLKLGGRITLRDREFASRRFYFRRTNQNHPDHLCGMDFDTRACPAQLFTDENVAGPALRLQEITPFSDEYRAGLNVHAGYAMADAGLSEQVRVVGGARVEATEQFVGTFSQFTGVDRDDRSVLESVDWLPAAAIIYSPSERINFRLAASRTLARPQLRELAPFLWNDFWGAITNSGNPGLTLTKIDNGDLRAEYFPSVREVVAMSLFVKRFHDPIEPVVIPGTSLNTLTYENAKRANLFGVEFEVRKELEFVAPVLEDFSVTANLTLTHSQIEVRQTAQDEGGIGFLTNTNRAMVQQAPYVANLMLDYETQGGTLLRLLYNVSGPRLVSVGVGGMDDGYLHPMQLLDFVAGQRIGERVMLRLSVTNILNSRWVVTQGKRLVEERITHAYREGTTASLSLTVQL